MIRKLFKVVVAGACVLSLLLCLAAAALWWHTAGGGEDGVEGAMGALKVDAYAGSGVVRVNVLRGWPGPPGFWAQSVRPDSSAATLDFEASAATDWRAGPVRGAAGTARAFVGPDGRVRRVTFDEIQPSVLFDPTAAAGLSAPFPYTYIDVAFWFVVPAFALPPILWLATAGRRRFVARRRRRRGRCVGCGYDLTGNVSGTCPECGGATAKGSL